MKKLAEMKVIRGAAMLLLALVLITGAYSISALSTEAPLFSFGKESSPSQVKLYWLTADGLRADTGLFNMYKWGREGNLPNIKKLMDRGAYGYSLPEFPSLTSNNIATLHTGATAKVHGII